MALSPWLLIAANTLPLLGVLFWAWDSASVVVFFWAENLIIGLFNVVKMLSFGSAQGLFLALFFTVHYGGFTVGHGLFIAQLFGLEASSDLALDALWFWGFVGLVISHGGSLLLNFFLGGERARTTPAGLMAAPYKRIVILHVTIIVGGMGVEALGSPLPLLVLLVLLKVAVDLRGHLREHDRRWQDLLPYQG